ncbi:HNH endonuclease signature motif containing protein [Corynebacterium liangguodongii]|uniref:HNH endonuclease n=1 Tax=Corynebacterium liangguodongii TaxID=2079535 RepID=A0A2S0WBV7_9CORY|nr:HNH endonuclease signature motif containing protein [Corynebacterium liangguodongii]AWB83248.1 HNH endonuclease [Corynebacterium liangguodongii]PWC00662.1 HNH endonuclease [Corynebacterium liangguodongii]
MTRDQRLEGARLMTEGEYLLFGSYARGRDEDNGDYDTEVAELMALSHRSKRFVESGIFGYMRLGDLPQLRALQDEHRIIDVTRLSAIDSAMSVLPPGTTTETFTLCDDLLVSMFTPAHLGHPLPTLWSITRRLRRLIATIDPSVDFDPKKRRARERSRDPRVSFYPCGNGQAGLNLHADATTIAACGAFIRSTARAHKLGAAETMVKLLTGALTPEPKAMLHVYSPGIDGERQPGTSAFLPGLGWTDAESTAALDELLAASPVTVIDLDAVRSQRVGGYTPTAKMASYVRARDGACVFPGCHVPAERCQLDHRIPYGQGGETTPDNLHCLCQRHHNFKTDKRGFYIPDPATGETIWLFADGTWITSEAKGILRDNLTPTNPRWATTRERVRARRAHIARFNAACHAACDEYDSGADYGATVAKIKHLEEEFDLTFDYPPQPEDLSWIPPEPDDTEPPYPDPLA